MQDNNSNILSKFYNYLNASLDKRIYDLSKSEDLTKGERVDGTVGRRSVLFDPYMETTLSTGMYRPRVSYLTPEMLKQVSRRNPVVASLIDLRALQVQSFCQIQETRFDMGFKIMPIDKNEEADQEDIKKIEKYILNCGETEDRPPEDKMTFEQWGYMITRDFLVYGHASIEKVRRRDESLYSFLPVPAESIYYASRRADSKQIANFRSVYDGNFRAKEKGMSHEDIEAGDYEFVQVLHGQVVEGFTKDELIFARLTLESDIDLNGYGLGPLERAVAAITSHMQIENHQKQIFVHGTASKGVLVLNGDVSPNTLKALQSQWNNSITGPLNAWRTPILAGPGLQANWLALSPTNRDMEYAAYQDYILRVIFSCFKVDPEEVGFGYLSKGTDQRSLGEASNEWKINSSKDRGLRPILARIEHMINAEILPEYNESLSKKYRFKFVGLDSETANEEIERLQAEVQLHSNLDEIRQQADMEPLDIGGGLILNPLYLQTLQANMPKGEFMEKFLGIQGASERPDLQYVPDPFWFQWQQMQQQMMQMQAGAMAGGGNPNAVQDESGEQHNPDGKFKRKKGTEDQQAPGQPQVDPEQQQAMAEAQAAAVEQYIQANPELFKSMKANLKQAEDLRKAEKQIKDINTVHVEETTEKLVKEYRKAGEWAVREILGIIKDDIKDDE